MRLLVSVRNLEEARAARAGGADLIDIKEPLRGALGAADPAVWRDVLSLMNGAVPVSAALGELAGDFSRQPDPLAIARETRGLRYVKIGLAGALRRDWFKEWRALLEQLPAGVSNVAVCYADWRSAGAPNPQAILESAEALGSAAVLFDTFDKSRGDLFQQLPPADLDRWTSTVRALGMKLVLAGGLTLNGIDRAARYAPDYIGVRGAACRRGRTSAVDEALVRQLAERVHEASACPAAVRT